MDDEKKGSLMTSYIQRNRHLLRLFGVSTASLTMLGAAPSIWLQPSWVASAGIDTERSVLTQHNDNQRTGAYLFEARLTPTNVSASSFGLSFKRTVDGYVRTQPLYVRGVLSGGVPRNLAIVATTLNTVYAFDADAGAGSADVPIWKRSLGQPSNQIDCTEPSMEGPLVGVMSTPVVDPTTNALYVVARAQNSAGSIYFQLNKLDVGTGKILAWRTIDSNICGPGTPPKWCFSPGLQYQRPGLLLSGGFVYAAFGGRCDAGGGWVMAWATSDLRPSGTFLTTESGKDGAAIWQSGGGLVADGNGDVYFETGNSVNCTANLAESFVRIRRSGVGSLSRVAKYTPANCLALDQGDVDLGSGAPMLIPRTTLIIGGGKQGILYLLDTGTGGLNLKSSFQAYCNLYTGSYTSRFFNDCAYGQASPTYTKNSTNNSTYNYDLEQTNGPNIHGGLVFWQNSAAGGYLYAMPEKDVLTGYPFAFATGTIDTSNPLRAGIASSPYRASSTDVGIELTPNKAGAMPGGTVSISANGQSNAIAWVLMAKRDAVYDGKWGTQMGRLMAFDALTLQELWRDESDVPFAKFIPPTIADGKVFRVTGSDNNVDGTPNPSGNGHLLVYGPCSGVACNRDPPRLAWENIGGGFSGPIGTVRTASGGTPHDFVFVEAGGNVWYKDGSYASEKSTTTNWSPTQTGWSSLGRPSDTPIASGTRPVVVPGAKGASNRATVFARGANGTLYCAIYDGVNWGAWTSLGGVTPNEPAVVVVPGSSALYVFVRGTGNDLLYKHRSDSLVWSPSQTEWYPLQGALIDDAPSAVIFDDWLSVFVHANNEVTPSLPPGPNFWFMEANPQIWYRQARIFNCGSSCGVWSNWTQATTKYQFAGTPVPIATTDTGAPHYLHLIGVELGTSRILDLIGDNINPWITIDTGGFASAQAKAAVSYASDPGNSGDHVYIYVRSPDNQLWVGSTFYATGTTPSWAWYWSGLFKPPGSFSGDPAVAYSPTGRVDVFARSSVISPNSMGLHAVWTGDGKDKFAVRRGNQIFYQQNFGDTSGVKISYGNGKAEDGYFVGDWTGDGKDKFAVRRGNRIFYQKHLGDPIGVELSYGNGKAEDEYLVGDWTGDGKDKFAVRRGNRIFYQKHLGDPIGVELSYGNGKAEDEYFVGDWTGDGNTKFAVRRGNKIFYQQHLGDPIGVEIAFGNGKAEDGYLVGDWTGDGKAKFAVRRGNKIFYQQHLGDTVGVELFYGNGKTEDGYLVGKF